MENKVFHDRFLLKNEKIKHFFRIMKITTLLLFVGILSIYAEDSYSQKARVTINEKNIRLDKVLTEIEKQTDYLFIYNDKVETNQNVSVKANTKPVYQVLNDLFKETNVGYSMEGSHIILSNRNEQGVSSVNTPLQEGQTITGKVQDANGEPLIGVSVAVKGTTTGTVTDIDGAYTLKVTNPNATLVFSFIGFLSQEVVLRGQSLVNVTLTENVKMLDDVVVTALGIKRQQRSLGYSTTSVGGDDFTQSRDINIGNALSGKVAGVSVAGNATGAGGSSRVIIRGNASLTGNNQPLYVIDGVPFNNSNLGSAGTWGGMDMGDGLSNISPDDISNIQVLKGAAASALYGYRGGNGAILVTTKSGKKGQPTSIEFNNSLTFNNIYDYRDFQKTFGQGENGIRPMTQESAVKTETSSWGERLDGGKAINFLGNEYKYSYVDNWDSFYRTGVNDAASLSVSGASDKIIYRFGLSNMYDKSILPNSYISQQGINMNSTYNVTSKIQLMVNANYVFEKFKGRSNLSDGNGNTNASLLYRANSFDVRWLERGTPGSDWGTTADGKELIGGDNVYFNNPYWLQYRKTNETNKNRLTGGLTLKYDIFDWLYIQGAVTRDGYSLDFKQVQPMGAAADPAGWLTEYSKTFSEINLNYLIGFNKTFGDWSTAATFGGNRQRNITKQWMADGVRPFLVPGFTSVNNVGNRPMSKSHIEYRVNSIYATADFGYKNQIFLNLTGRNDWFSTLNPDNNSYFYPSAGVSWVFTDTFDVPAAFEFGKVRVAYASASNGTDPYQNILTYKLNNYIFNGQNNATVNNETYPNPNLKPVRISEWEAGLNLAFFKNRLSFDMAYYIKNTKDDIARITTSSASGFSSTIMNVGEIKNKGLEFMVDAVPVQTRDFMWNTTFNISHNNSEVKYLGENGGIPVTNLSIDGASARSGNVTVQNIVGKPYGELVGYKYKRVDGQIVYKDGIAQSSDELENLGSGVYKLTGGWRNQLTFKDWTLSFLIDFKFGAKLFSGTNYSLYSNGLHKNTLEGRGEDGKGTIIGNGVMLDASGNYVANNVAVSAQEYWKGIVSNNIAEEFIYNASFIKFRELSLGYNFPKSILGQNSAVKGLSVSLVARNLWTILKYTDNIDPESAYNNTNGQGLELNGYPATRSIGFNVNVKF
jgi:TonB-linked SusC/RagA family outer membrane protein